MLGNGGILLDGGVEVVCCQYVITRWKHAGHGMFGCGSTLICITFLQCIMFSTSS